MKVEALVTVIAASCILNNICEINKEDVLENWVQETGQQREVYPQPTGIGNEVIFGDDAVSVRDLLSDFFMSDQGSGFGTG